MIKTEKELIVKTSAGEIQADRPTPITADVEVVLYKQHLRPQYAVDALIEGYSVLVGDYYSSGLAILNQLKIYVNAKYPDQSFQGQREARSAYRELSNRLFLKITGNRLMVKKAPEIGWLKVLYPDLPVFLLPFPQVQGLNSSWQWYEKGIFIPVLRKKIFPWFGTYFPTRFEHLELFENWLKNYRGSKESAIDVGTGSGVLTFQMLKYGFAKIYGTDSNPNAVIGVDEYLDKNQLQSKVDLYHGDLFAGCDIPAELIVFNPPWLPAAYNPEGIDSAIYYEADMFARFFKEATTRLKEGGRVVVLFSNLAEAINPDTEHPVKSELANGGRFTKEQFVEKQVRPASKKTKRNQEKRSDEKVELWVLKLINV
ncbi:MAG: methyltransferase [Lentimicrobium sp.]|nr:methyltransferase [Lentimicrobium sp.]